VRHWYSRWADSQHSVPPSCCRRTPTIQIDMTDGSATHFAVLREDVMEFKLKNRTPLDDITKAVYS